MGSPTRNNDYCDMTYHHGSQAEEHRILVKGENLFFYTQGISFRTS